MVYYWCSSVGDLKLYINVGMYLLQPLFKKICIYATEFIIYGSFFFFFFTFVCNLFLIFPLFLKSHLDTPAFGCGLSVVAQQCFYYEISDRIFGIVYIASLGLHRLSTIHSSQRWDLCGGLCVSSSSASPWPPFPCPVRPGSTSRLMTRWPGSRASLRTRWTGPPWPPSPPTNRWWASRSLMSSRWATGQGARAPGCLTCTWPAWRSPCRTWRWAWPRISVLKQELSLPVQKSVYKLEFSVLDTLCICAVLL